ncbi:MAG: DUF2157 domain-containing protein [Chitinophagaceae bacterium]|nr:DUF2157 domain-containing protein [Chitinophagaceae bacterium]
MANPDREDIHIISRHSNLSASSIRTALREFVYSGKDAWQQFLRIFFLSLGAGFMISGVIFFFAYNWDQLHKFVKLGIMEGLIILLTIGSLFIKNDLVRKILLTTASMLIGVLFAVFGQVYQTGADAFDLFRNWMLCITIWVIVAEFAPLWVIWIALANITAITYLQQRGQHIPRLTPFLVLFLINTASLKLALLLKHKTAYKPPQWFIILVAIAAAAFGTIGVSIGIFDPPDLVFSVLLTAVLLGFGAATWYGLTQRSIFFLALTGCCVIVILCAAILNVSNDSGAILFICLFLAIGITALIKSLLILQKKWSYEKTA